MMRSVVVCTPHQTSWRRSNYGGWDRRDIWHV